jgi:hypothetical protein
VAVMGVNKFQRLFRDAAGLDVDKDDLKRYSDFAGQKTYDLLLMAEPTARANDRGIILDSDLPITKGLQESIHSFRKLPEAIEVEPILERLAGLPQLDLMWSVEVESRLPEILGGITVALGRTLRLLLPDADSRHASTELWERAFRIFDTLL